MTQKCEHTLHIQSVRSSSIGWYKAVLTTPILYIRCVLPNAREVLSRRVLSLDAGTARQPLVPCVARATDLPDLIVEQACVEAGNDVAAHRVHHETRDELRICGLASLWVDSSDDGLLVRVAFLEFAVVRLRREFLESSTLGGIIAISDRLDNLFQSVVDAEIGAVKDSSEIVVVRVAEDVDDFSAFDDVDD